MKKHYSLVLCLVLLAVLGSAQQLTTSSFYELQGTLHNPALAGNKQHTSMGINYRTLWSRMPGSPRTALIFGGGYLPKVKVGLSGYLYKDVTGPISYTGLQTAYAYHLPLSEAASLSIGLEGRFQQFSVDQQQLQVALGPNDPVIQGDANHIKGDAGVGIAYTSKTLQVGASVSQLIQSKLDLYKEPKNTTAEAKLYRHYYLHGNYQWNVDGINIIIPNFLLIYLPNAPVELVGGARILHNDFLWAGLTWHSKQAWMVSTGFKVTKKVNVGYSFDLYRTPLSDYYGGSQGHELLLSYQFQ